jgi:DNA-directed RNA polymerase subunit RPC12/RpoP
MGRNIHGNYFEDIYQKQECQSCKRSFITGEKLAESMGLTCPYCQSPDIQLVAASAEEETEDMGCLALTYNLYDDGSLMLYTEREFAAALTQAASGGAVPLTGIMDCINRYCAERDGR